MDDDTPATKHDVSWVHIQAREIQTSLGNWIFVFWLCTQAQILLVGMKLAAIVDWSWLVIAAPTLVPFGLATLLGLFGIIQALFRPI